MFGSTLFENKKDVFPGLDSLMKSKPKVKGKTSFQFQPTLVDPSKVNQTTSVDPSKTNRLVSDTETETTTDLKPEDKPPLTQEEIDAALENFPLPFGLTFEDKLGDPEAREYTTKWITAEDLERLGLDESWIGLPYSIGYTDENGNWIEEKELLSTTATQLHDLMNLERPEISSLVDSAPYQQMTDLLAQMNGPVSDVDAIANFEAQIGMNPGEMATTLGAMLQQMQLGKYNQTGMSQAEQDAWDRSTGTQMQGMSEEAKMLLESLGHQGRGVEAFMQGDQIARNLADFRNERELQKVNEDNLRKVAEYDALEKRYNFLLGSEQISIKQYQDALLGNRMGALQGYAQQISALAQQNQTNIEAYTAHANVVYQSIMADIGVSESLMNQASEYFEQYMAPYYAQWEKEAMDAQIAAQNDSNFWTAVSTLVSGVTTALFFFLQKKK